MIMRSSILLKLKTKSKADGFNVQQYALQLTLIKHEPNESAIRFHLHVAICVEFANQIGRSH